MNGLENFTQTKKIPNKDEETNGQTFRQTVVVFKNIKTQAMIRTGQRFEHFGPFEAHVKQEEM